MSYSTAVLKRLRQGLAARGTIVEAAQRKEIALLRKALDFRASVTRPLEGGYHGGDLLRAVAFYMDRRDDERDMASGATSSDRTVQADLRRWAADVDSALAESPLPSEVNYDPQLPATWYLAGGVGEDVSRTVGATQPSLRPPVADAVPLPPSPKPPHALDQGSLAATLWREREKECPYAAADPNAGVWGWGYDAASRVAQSVPADTVPVDAERLALAMTAAGLGPTQGFNDVFAVQIAREYAALTSAPSEEKR